MLKLSRPHDLILYHHEARPIRRAISTFRQTAGRSVIVIGGFGGRGDAPSLRGSRLLEGVERWLRSGDLIAID